MRRQNLKHAEHKPVISAGKTKSRAFITADVHEQLRAWRAAADQFGKLNKMIFRCDNEMKAEIYPCPGFSDLAKFIKNRKIGVRAHDI